jgi:hypothetical protein
LCIKLVIIQFHSKMHGPYNIKYEAGLSQEEQTVVFLDVLSAWDILVPTSFHFFVVDKITVGQILSEYFEIFLSSSIHLCSILVC